VREGGSKREAADLPWRRGGYERTNVSVCMACTLRSCCCINTRRGSTHHHHQNPCLSATSAYPTPPSLAGSRRENPQFVRDSHPVSSALYIPKPSFFSNCMPFRAFLLDFYAKHTDVRIYRLLFLSRTYMRLNGGRIRYVPGCCKNTRASTRLAST
jgi:hypothetical protein